MSVLSENPVLHIPQPAIESTQSQQFDMRAALDNAPVVKDDNLIHIFKANQPVCDQQERAEAGQVEERLENAARSQGR